MAYTKTTWKNRVVQNPNTYLQQQNADGTVTLVPKEGTVTEAGTPVNAVNMNHIEDGISSIDTANSIYSAGGTANGITVATPNGDYAYEQFKRLSIKATADNTGNVTINVDNQGAVPALKFNGDQLDAGQIKAGKVYDFYYDTTGNCFFLVAKASGNAVAADVLAGKKCSTDMGDVVGTMPNNGAITITPGTTDQAIPAGYHNGQGKVIGVPIASGTGKASTSGLTGTASIRNLNFRPRAVTVMWPANNVKCSVVYIPGGRNNIMQPTSNSGANTPTIIIWDIFSDGFSVRSTNTNLLGNHDFNWIALL